MKTLVIFLGLFLLVLLLPPAGHSAHHHHHYPISRSVINPNQLLPLRVLRSPYAAQQPKLVRTVDSKERE